MKHDRIDCNPKVMFGKYVIKGTRIPVEHVLRKVGAGMTHQQIIADHPELTPQDIQAAAAFAAAHLASEEIVFAAGNML